MFSSTLLDIDTWKKKNSIDLKTKVFILIGGYVDIRESLLRRGKYFIS